MLKIFQSSIHSHWAKISQGCIACSFSVVNMIFYKKDKKSDYFIIQGAQTLTELKFGFFKCYRFYFINLFYLHILYFPWKQPSFPFFLLLVVFSLCWIFSEETKAQLLDELEDMNQAPIYHWNIDRSEPLLLYRRIIRNMFSFVKYKKIKKLWLLKQFLDHTFCRISEPFKRLSQSLNIESLFQYDLRILLLRFVFVVLFS